MRKVLVLAVAGLVAGAASLLAQVPDQGPQGRPDGLQTPVESLNPEEWAGIRTDEMTEKYNLNPEQQKAMFDLNRQYAGKLEFTQPEGPGGQSGQMRQGGRREQAAEGGSGERRAAPQMSQEEREKMFAQREERMAQREEQLEQIQQDRKAYDKAVKGILDKKQYKAFRKEFRKEDQQIQNLLNQSNGMGNPMGGPPGGFGGPGGGGPGGFGGGGFGGPGGF